MTSQTETVDATKMLAYMDENYNTPSQKGDKTEPFDCPREGGARCTREPAQRRQTYQEENVANNEETNSVTNKNANA